MQTPLVVPFQQKTTSEFQSIPARFGREPYGALRTLASSLSCLVMSVAQPCPKLSKSSTVTGLAPSILHIAHSKAPVSLPGIIPMR